MSKFFLSMGLEVLVVSRLDNELTFRWKQKPTLLKMIHWNSDRICFQARVDEMKHPFSLCSVVGSGGPSAFLCTTGGLGTGEDCCHVFHVFCLFCFCFLQVGPALTFFVCFEFGSKVLCWLCVSRQLAHVVGQENWLGFQAYLCIEVQQTS